MMNHKQKDNRRLSAIAILNNGTVTNIHKWTQMVIDDLN